VPQLEISDMKFESTEDGEKQADREYSAGLYAKFDISDFERRHNWKFHEAA
jgi:hypothetical protein